MEANWDDLKVVLAVARTGSLTQAAEALGIDQSTCSRRLAAVEAGLGTILFQRSRAGLSVTETGEIAVSRAVEIERRMLRMAEELARGPDGPVGSVRLLGHPWMLERLAGGAARRLLETHPRLDLRLVPEPARAGVRAEPTLGLRFEQTPRDGEFAIRLCEVPYAFYRARDRAPETLPWVSVMEEEAAQLAHVKALERVRRKGERVRLGSGDNRVLMAAVRDGVGKGLLPVCLAERVPDLARLDPGPPDLIRVLHLHLHPDTVQTQRVQAVTRWLRETAEAAFGEPALAAGEAVP